MGAETDYSYENWIEGISMDGVLGAAVMDDHSNNLNGSLLRRIIDATFRANPKYRLVLFDRLPPDQQRFFRDLTKDSNFYGVLLPAEGSLLRTKSVCQSTALLLLTLADPGRLPLYIYTSLGSNANQAIAELVLDGVLEMELGGEWYSGSKAYDLVYNRPYVEATSVPLPELTRRALKYATLLDLDDIHMLSARLYGFNRVPLSLRWKRLFPNTSAVEAYLGIDSKGALRPKLELNWRSMRSSLPSEGWFQWASRERRAAPQEREIGYKLYVSPMPEFIQQAFTAVVDCLTQSQAYHFKIGNNALGLLRPDKLVIYFHSYESLQETAKAIGDGLGNCPAQGVPFTAALDDRGLLSWGVDPPRQDGVLAWQERESWRLRITNRIANAMLAARQSQNARLEPWRFALERIRLDNIDTDTWTPLSGFGR